MIATERLTLRKARPDDLQAMHAIFSRADAMAYWDTLPHKELATTRRFLDQMIAADPKSSDDFIVEHQGALIGKAGFWRKPEVGYIFHPDQWGKGFGKEALLALIERAFDHHRWDHITAEIDPRNERSRRLLLGLGFDETGFAEKTLKLGDAWVDSAYFKLVRSAA
ncbi:MAG: GNAT family N-acetyltransferase [Pseudomonadota bacterium]